jgi:hypothetical protein
MISGAAGGVDLPSSVREVRSHENILADVLRAFAPRRDVFIVHAVDDVALHDVVAPAAFHFVKARQQFLFGHLLQRLVDLGPAVGHLHHRPVAVGAELEVKRRIGRLHRHGISQQRDAFPGPGQRVDVEVGVLRGGGKQKQETGYRQACSD